MKHITLNTNQFDSLYNEMLENYSNEIKSGNLDFEDIDNSITYEEAIVICAMFLDGYQFKDISYNDMIEAFGADIKFKLSE